MCWHSEALLHAAPPIESCPYDSIQVEDTCKCNHKICSKPPCLYELNIAVNGTDIPGNCCAVYSCDGCANETLIEGKCPCAPGATLNSKGECTCIDPHKNLINNECVCDPDKCELPQICDRHHVSVTDKEGCCMKTKCIKCPDDSFATNNNDEAIDDKCVCYPCTNECGPNERVVVIQRGSGFPSSCCDLYKCESGDLEKKCIVEEVIYSEGESWETADAQTCKCQGGISFCSKPTEEETFRSCHQEGSVYKHNESWMVDSCTNCTCFNGETKCIAHMCEVSEGHLKKPECQPLNCTKVCPDGNHIDPFGNHIDHMGPYTLLENISTN
ncbi:hypothetical protein BDFB_003923 [Asbolus verrucosus]|uniref:VWFC domain-containing protein n=1 Tax=Asbolus verrucosus TaxID=1661398 RepID=A0A482VL86_ASBVE|nr:hypothetical protein BDFB_003923 [Asbolus verrucosus]